MQPATPDRRKSSRVETVLAACLLALALPVLAAPARAAEPRPLSEITLPELRLGMSRGLLPVSLTDVSGFRPTAELVPARGRRTVAFYDTHLLPRLNGQFQPFRAYENMPEAGEALEDFTLRRQVTDSAESNAVRGATKAFRDFLIDLTPAEKWLSSLPHPSTEIRGRRGGASLGFSFGISHAMPELGLRYRVGNTVTRVELDSFGAVDVEFTHSAAAWTRLALWYEPRNEWYGVSCRFGF